MAVPDGMVKQVAKLKQAERLKIKSIEVKCKKCGTGESCKVYELWKRKCAGAYTLRRMERCKKNT